MFYDLVPHFNAMNLCRFFMLYKRKKNVFQNAG